MHFVLRHYYVKTFAESKDKYWKIEGFFNVLLRNRKNVKYAFFTRQVSLLITAWPNSSKKSQLHRQCGNFKIFLPLSQILRQIKFGSFGAAKLQFWELQQLRNQNLSILTLLDVEFSLKPKFRASKLAKIAVFFVL